MVKLEDQYIALIAYASAYGFLVVLIGIYVYFHRKKKQQKPGLESDKSYIQEVWFAREIYAAVVVHLYDQATDVAIMVQWARFLEQELSGERDLKGVNMLTFFIPGIGFIILYRVITMVFAIYEDTKTEEEHVVYRDMDKQKEHQRSKKSVWIIIWDLILAAFDLYFVKIVYLEFENEEKRPNATHRSLQLCEALFESMPQVVLQSVFLLRYTASQSAADDKWAVALIIISITASILSIGNKYSWFDRQAVVFDAKRLNGGRKGECYISWRFLLRQIWRWSDLFARFVILTLIWTCVGGVFLLIYLCVSYLFYYFVVLNRIKMADKNPWYRLLATTICIVGIILDYEWHFCILRLIDNGVMMIVVSVFAFVVDSDRKDGSNTSIIFTFVFMGLIAYGIEVITYPILQSRSVHIIKKALQGRQFFSIILFGDDSEIPCYYLTYFIDNSADKEVDNRGLSVSEIEYFTGKKSSEDCEKLGEDLEKAISKLIDDNKSLHIDMNTGDIAIDYKTTKVFKYGISFRCLQNVNFGERALQFIQELYSKEETKKAVKEIFDEHFKKRDCSKSWSLTFDTKESIFIVVNNDDYGAKTDGRQPVVAKYRFGEEFKKYNKDVRIINGHDYDAGLHVMSKQVAIKVLDRWFVDRSIKKYSKKNEDIFLRERCNLELLNAQNIRDPQLNILAYIGWDDADDAYFLVTKRLFGDKILERVSRNEGVQCAKLMKYIRQMFELIAYVHNEDIVMRNISDNSFQFDIDDDDDEKSEMYLVHYENSKRIENDSMYGNLKQKVLYLSPELCKIVKSRYKNKTWCEDISGSMYRASDVWALGILTYYLLLGKHPYFRSGATPNKLKRTLNKIMNHDDFEYLEAFKYDELNKLFTDFMNKILCNDYNQRMTCKQCLQHEFLSSKFIDKFEKSERMKPEIVHVLKGNVIQTKLRESIARVRAEQIERKEKKSEHRQSAVIAAAAAVNHNASAHLIKTDKQIERIFDLEAEQEMKDQFKRIDLDGDGYTTIDELTKLLTSLGYALNFAQKEAAFIMKELDQDGDGTIDFNEFAQAWITRKLSINDKYAHAIFHVFDENGDGFISIEELKHALFPDDDDEERKDNKEEEEEDDEDDDDGYLANFFKQIEDERENEQLEEILREVDDNKDGKISFDEFHKAMIGDMKDSEDVVPFKNIFYDVSFKEINENGRDPLFENEKEYLKINEIKQSQNRSIAVPITNELETAPSITS